jgi:uncharacterized heparinase superfamily protein
VTRRALGRWLRTVRFLRPQQVAGQLRLRLRGSRAPRLAAGPPPELAISAPAAAFLPAPAHAWCDGARRFRLRNREVAFADRVDWDFADAGPLWAYDLHSFEWARRPSLAPAARRALILDWIARHPRGIGWSPHPLSLRTASWLKLLLTPGALGSDEGTRRAILTSLGAQLSHLSANLETHLLANHYLSNLLAVTLGGVALAGKGAEHWLGHERRLRGELAEQVLADGLHCERSPMYHACLLETVLDVLNVAQAKGGRAPDALREALAETAGRMLGALSVLTHPDGEIALFADSALGIAQPPGALADYAARLGVTPRHPARSGVLEAGGYVRLERGPFVLLASVAGPMPAHQPGHAHCDALSFELSVGPERVVTDTGVHEYIPGRLRDLSRATRSHATLEVGGEEQAELWAAHRIGGRPLVALEVAEPGASAAARCAGWATPGIRHQRVWELSDDSLTIRDRLEGRACRARLTLPLAPGVEVRLDGARARLRLAGGGWLRVELEGGPVLRVERAPYFPEFGRRVERSVLVAEADPWPATVLRITRPRTISGA